MNEDEVRQLVSAALERVIDEDTDLLRFDVNERSITHRLAVYLGEEIDDDWDVDTEYNRVGEDEVSKAVPVGYLKSKISDDVDPDELDAKTVYPDVVVHNRGERYENLLVIEAKKLGRSGEYDREKVTAYNEELQYKFGVFVTFEGTRSDAEPDYHCDWYPFDECP